MTGPTPRQQAGYLRRLLRRGEVLVLDPRTGRPLPVIVACAAVLMPPLSSCHSTEPDGPDSASVAVSVILRPLPTVAGTVVVSVGLTESMRIVSRRQPEALPHRLGEGPAAGVLDLVPAQLGIAEQAEHPFADPFEHRGTQPAELASSFEGGHRQLLA